MTAAALPRYRKTKKEEAFLSERLFGVLFRKILGKPNYLILLVYSISSRTLLE